MTVAAELRAKQRFERIAHQQLTGFYSALLKEYERVLAASGRVISAQARGGDALMMVLREHYSRVATHFANTLRPRLPRDVQITPEEAAEVSAELSRIFTERASRQALLITLTTQAVFENKWEKTRQLAAEAALNGEPLSRAEQARLAMRLVWRNTAARVGSTASYETQLAAETAKGVEALVLTGGLDRVEIKHTRPTKVWDSQGDSRVRTPPDSPFNHLAADGQRVPMDKPFRVSGQSLNWPGDTSLGATLGNVIGCRCGALYDVEEIAELRRTVLRDREVFEDEEQPFSPTESTVIVGRDLPTSGKPPTPTPPPRPPIVPDVDPVGSFDELGFAGIRSLEDIPGLSDKARTAIRINTLSVGDESLRKIRRSLQANVMPDALDVDQLISSINTPGVGVLPTEVTNALVRNTAEWGRRGSQLSALETGLVPQDHVFRFNHFHRNLDDAMRVARGEIEQANVGVVFDDLRGINPRELTPDQRQRITEARLRVNAELKRLNQGNDVVNADSMVPSMRKNSATLPRNKPNPALWSEVQEEIGEITEGGVGAGNLFTHDSWKNVRVSARGRDRAWANYGQMHFSKVESRGTIAHEFGHIIEMKNPNVKRRIDSFFARRIDEAKAAGESRPTRIYEWARGENGWQDGFYDKYVGKVYRSGDTEILSMGLEAIRSDMKFLRMMQDDPGHFELIWSILRGY